MDTAKADERSTADLVGLLEFEIQQNAAHQAQAGWSDWVLLVALAAVIWAFLNRLPQTLTVWSGVTVDFALFSLAYFVLHDAVLLLRVQFANSRSGPRFIVANEAVASARPTFVWWFLWSASCLVALVRDPLLIGLHFWLPAVVVCGQMVLPVLLLGSSGIDLAIPIPDAEHVLRLVWIVPVLTVIVGLVSLVVSASTIATNGVDVVQSSALLVAIAAIVHYWAELSQPNSESVELVAIRRGLSLGELPLDVARRRCETALYGMRFRDLLANEVSATMEMLRVAREAVESLGKVGGFLDVVVTDKEFSGTYDDDELKTAETLVDNATRVLPGADASIARAEMNVMVMARKASLALYFAPRAVAEWESMIRGIRSEIETVRAARNGAVSLPEQLVVRLQQMKIEGRS